MATRTHSVFINTVGILYASLGFSLSVLALFGIFNHFINPPQGRSFHARPHLPRKLRKLRGPRTVSGQTCKTAVPKPPEHPSVAKECTHDVKALRRRSKSLVPIITLDHFEFTNSLDFSNSLPKPVLPTESLLPNFANTDGPAMELSTVNRPRLKRRCTSPLVLSYAASLPEPSAHDSLLVPSRKESKSSSTKTSRKTPSTADLNQETITTKLDALFVRKAGKKKSLTLRTQPYGPPYFCTPPLPIPSKSQSS